ncbi:MAG: hypothetical protein ABSA97_06225 [Verrucomicrobiia bacterium]|jgi:hypothetical protein
MKNVIGPTISAGQRRICGQCHRVAVGLAAARRKVAVDRRASVAAVFRMSANNITIAPSWASSSSTNEPNLEKADIIVPRA